MGRKGPNGLPGHQILNASGLLVRLGPLADPWGKYAIGNMAESGRGPLFNRTLCFYTFHFPPRVGPKADKWGDSQFRGSKRVNQPSKAWQRAGAGKTSLPVRGPNNFCSFGPFPIFLPLE